LTIVVSRIDMIDPTITIPQTFQTHGSIRSPAAGLVALALIDQKTRTLKPRLWTADAGRVLGAYAAITFSSFDLAFSAGVAALLLVLAVVARVIIGRSRPPAVARPVRTRAPAQVVAEADEREAVAAG
jgi:hypothetical protein